MMVVQNDNVISLIYELRKDNAEGEIIEALNPNSPLEFVFGAGRLLPKFESNISGLSIGDKFSFDLDAKDAYGELNKDAIVNVPKQAFEINGKIDNSLLQVGKTIPMQDTSGNRLNGVVKEIGKENVKMDFNHPLAGEHLFFQGEITQIRKATDEELSHGHVGGGCSCNDKDCADGCC